MKPLMISTLMALLGLLPLASAQASMRALGSGESDNRVLLLLNADGSCVLTNETVQSRKSLEMQVASWERFSGMEDSAMPDDDDTAAPAPQAPKSVEPKSLSNTELAAKLSELYQQNREASENVTYSVENKEGDTNLVRLITAHSFASLKDLLSEHPYTWGPSFLMFEDARLELNTNRNLQFTFTASPSASRYTKNVSREWKGAKMKYEWKLVLPGKILSSSLPHTQDHATWLSLNGDQPETVEAALKLIGAPLVITAEAASLKLDEPLESKKLVRSSWRHRNSEPELPLTDAGPGFQAEPASLSLNTVHLFPEAARFFKDRPESFLGGMGSTGTVISAKFFAPKGRILRSVSNVRVKSAKDDQGRPIACASATADEEGDSMEYTSYSSGDSDKEGGATGIQLHLALPAPDAKTIDEVQAEAVALTIGGWKTLVLTNIQADAKKEIDLTEVLPGAKLIIKKVVNKGAQKRVEATVTGPSATVRQLDLQIKSSSRHGASSNQSERQAKTSGATTTRNLTVQAYEFEMGQDTPDQNRPLTLLVRYPQDVKRERVQFKLTALDLL